jgi:hypothetical protein
MAFGSNPLTTGQGALPSNQFPLSSVFVPGTANGDLTTLEGGPASTDVNNNKSAPVSMYVKDGGDVAQGTTTDAAYSGSGAGTEIAILKKLVALLSAAITISGTVTSNAGTNTSTAALALETGGNLASAKIDLDNINTAIGAISDAAYSGSGNGSEIALLKKIVAELAATLTVSGTVTANAGTGTMTVGQATGTNLHTVIDAGSAVIGHIIADSGSTTAVTSLPALPSGSNLIGNVELVDSAGTNKATISAGGAVKVDNSAVTQPVSGTFWQATQPVSGAVTSNAGTNLNTSLLAVESGGHLATIDTSTAASKTDLDIIVTNTNKIPASSASGTLQSAQAGNANGSTLNVLGMGSANFTVNMSAFSGSVIFEGSGDGTNFQSIQVNQQGSNSFSTIANGATSTSIILYTCSVASLQLIRARTSSVTAGTVTVTAEAVPQPWSYSASTLSTTQGTSPWVTSLVDGVGGVTPAGVDSSNRLKTIVSSALPSGTNVIGHVIADSGSTTAVTSLPALPAGSNLIGNVELVDSAGTNKASIDASGNQAVKGGFTEQSSLSAASLNADLVPSTDVSAYKWLSIHVTGVFSATYTFQGSNDNTNFVSVVLVDVSNAGGNGSGSSSTISGKIWAGPVAYRYLRVRLTAYTSGTATGTLELYTSPTALQGMAVNSLQQGTWTVQPGNTPNTSPWLESIHDGTNKANVLAATSVSNASTAQGALLTAGAFAEQASLSAGVLNADLVASTDVSSYKWFSIHVNATAYVGTLTIQGSNDNTNFVSVFAYNVTSGSLGTTISSTNQLLASAITYRFLRIRMTAYTSGTAQGTLELYTSPASWLSIQANQAGNWNVNIRDTGATTINSNGNALNVSGSHLNAVVAANTASNTVIKASSGVLCTVTVTTLGTAGISFFDSPTTNAGTVLLSIPASAAVGTIYTLNGAATTGITAAGVTNCPGLTVFYF